MQLTLDLFYTSKKINNMKMNTVTINLPFVVVVVVVPLFFYVFLYETFSVILLKLKKQQQNNVIVISRFYICMHLPFDFFFSHSKYLNNL